MKEVKFLAYVIIVGLLLALAWSMGLGLAQGQEPPEGEVQPQGEVSIAATLGSKFSYQGVLKENGSPATGSRNMTFRLYSDDTCSTQVGSDIVKSGVKVTDGLFSVELDVTHSDFNGQGLWLEVEVGGTKIGCQEILPVPYALSLRSGAIISDFRSYVELNRVEPTIPTASYGVYAKAEGGWMKSKIGVYGSGSDYGVYGHSSSGTAIYGSGDVKQNLGNNGLVKAAVYTYCGYCASCIPGRSFNNVNDKSINCICGASAGRCTIDFNFQLNDRFWVATATGATDYGVTCQLGSSIDEIDCRHWQAGTAMGNDGYIMVLVY